MTEMVLREIYDVMHSYALRNKDGVRGDKESCCVTFKDDIDGVTYSVSMVTRYSGKVNHITFEFPRQLPPSRMKEASRVANELNYQIRFGSFRLVEHSGRVLYCFDTVLEYSRVDTDYFAEIMSLSERTIKSYAAPLLALCE